MPASECPIMVGSNMDGYNLLCFKGDNEWQWPNRGTNWWYVKGYLDGWYASSRLSPHTNACREQYDLGYADGQGEAHAD